MLGGSVEFLADQELRKQGLDPVEDAEEYEAAWPATLERIKAQVAGRARRGQATLGGLYVARHRAARVAPHRQPAARSFRPSGRPGRVPVLPVARGRPDAAVQVRLGRPGAARAQGPRRRPDREQVGHQVDRLRAGAGRGAELRDPQERPQVRRRDEPAARGHLRRAPRGARGRRPARPDPRDDRRRRRRLRHRRDRGLPGGVGPRRAVDRAASTLYPISLRHQDLERRGRRPRRPGPRRPARASSRPTRRRRTTRARPSSAPR